jgi:hypothetical protein
MVRMVWPVTEWLVEPMTSCHLLNLSVIERSLRNVQENFGQLNARLDERRDPLVDLVRNNMLAGYALIDRCVNEGVDLFDLQQVDRLLEINTTVLCGTSRERRQEYANHVAATEARFFHNEHGVRDLLEWYDMHRKESVWKRAAGVFVRILSKPQLFIEGNHRSASLIASFLLLREGLPPFVLTVDNAVAYFNPASVVRRVPKKGIRALFQLPKIRKRYAELMLAESRPEFLLPLRNGAGAGKHDRDRRRQGCGN